MSSHLRWLAVIVVVTVVSVWMTLPNNPGIHIDFDGDGEQETSREIAVRPGLDLQGGLRVLLAADMASDQITSSDMQTARRIVENRVNALGVVEPVVQLQEGSNRIIVELPGISDPDVAIATIRETGLLEFVDFSGISDVSAWVGQRILTTAQIEQQAAAPEADVEDAAAETATEEPAATAESTEDAEEAATEDPVEEEQPALVNTLTVFFKV